MADGDHTHDYAEAGHEHGECPAMAEVATLRAEVAALREQPPVVETVVIEPDPEPAPDPPVVILDPPEPPTEPDPPVSDDPEPPAEKPEPEKSENPGKKKGGFWPVG